MFCDCKALLLLHGMTNNASTGGRQLSGAAGTVTQVLVNYASSPGKAEEVAAEVEKLGGEAITVKANVASRQEVDAMIKAATDKWGRIDVLVNNAGQGFNNTCDARLCCHAMHKLQAAHAVSDSPG